MKHLFISWGGDEAREIAGWLKENIFQQIPELAVYFSEATPAGTKWRTDLDKNLSSATNCVGILTDGAIDRPWFLYEISALGRKLTEVPILRFCDELPDRHPLSDLQMKDGLVFENILDIARSLLGGLDFKIQEVFVEKLQQRRQAWDEKASKLAGRQKKMSGLRSGIFAVKEAVDESVLFPELEANSCMRELARKTLYDLGDAFRTLKSSPQISLPRGRYPEYLIHLQERLRCRATAVALVDDVEEFWLQQTGVDILKSARSDSCRVFVFNNADDLSRYLDNLIQHRASYDVFVMSRAEFDVTARRHEIAGDFSVLTDPETGNAVTAFYDNATHSIKFTSSRVVVSRNRWAFDHIKERAHPFPEGWSAGSVDRQQYGEFEKTVFHQHVQLGLFHSDAIPIDRYDAFEEDHPFYREMHREMLNEFRAHAAAFDGGSAVDILEIGAGTGHFTKKLSQQPFEMRITPLEPDPKAQKVLANKLDHRRNVMKTNVGNALELDVESTYAFVFSSFSEHHIRREQRKEYLSRIRRALRPGGFFIVGDEFLRPHDEDDPHQYEDALGQYHQYIINEANREHNTELAELEKAAWDSGLPNSKTRVDYKVTVESYLRVAEASGFQIEKRECISPPEIAQTVGGIYVIVFWKPLAGKPVI